MQGRSPGGTLCSCCPGFSTPDGAQSRFRTFPSARFCRARASPCILRGTQIDRVGRTHRRTRSRRRPTVSMPQLQAPPKARKSDPSAAQFPLRVAAVDVGSNAIRFLAAEFSALGVYEVLEEERVPVRLGHDVFLTGRLTPEAIEAAVAAIARFRGRMEALGIEHYRAVATSATRESRNGDELVGRIRREAGIELETITGQEEARLVYLAVANRVRMGEEKWITVDVGGGSVEVSLVDANGILWSESHVMGSVRLLEELSSTGDDPARFQ